MRFPAGLTLAVLLSLAIWAGFFSVARADTLGEYWITQRIETRETMVRMSHYGRITTLVDHGSVATMIANAAASSIGPRWTATLVHIAKIESGLRCAPGGNGGGLFQFIGGTRARLGLSRSSAQSCSVNINAAMRYAAGCIRQGAVTQAHMMRCWNGGNIHARRLERAYRVALASL